MNAASALNVVIASWGAVLVLAIVYGFSVHLASAVPPAPRREPYSPSHAGQPSPLPGMGIGSSLRGAWRRWKTRPGRTRPDDYCPGCDFPVSGPCRCTEDCDHPDCQGGVR